MDREPRIIDQKVNGVIGVFQAGSESHDLLEVREIGGEDLDRDPVGRTEALRDLCECSFVTRSEHKVVPLGR